MKSLLGMRVDLNANAHVRIAELHPKVVEPAIFEYEPAAMRDVLGMHHLRNDLGCIPRTQPEDLAFLPPTPPRMHVSAARPTAPGNASSIRPNQFPLPAFVI